MYGIAIHHAIRVYHQHRMLGLPIAVAEVVAAFEGAWSSEGFYSREHEEMRLEEGRMSLAAFVARENASPRVPLATERDFKFKLGPCDTVVGRWDRIDEHADGIVLADYKTSQVQGQEKADERAAKSLKGEQLGLYALAYREVYGVTPVRVEMWFVGQGIVGSAGHGGGGITDGWFGLVRSGSRMNWLIPNNVNVGSFGLATYLFGCGQSVPHMMRSAAASIRACAIGFTSSYGGRSVALTRLAPEIFIQVLPSRISSSNAWKAGAATPAVAG